MMKALNPTAKQNQKKTLDNFWLRLFQRIDSLCKLQLIICPNSLFYTCESLLSPYFESLKRMYELLSHSISFQDQETIKRFQICEHAKNWISGDSEKELDLDVHSVVSGNINDWQDKFLISINFPEEQDWIEELRKTREKTHKGLTQVFKRWQTEGNRTFQDWHEEESVASGRVILQNYFSHLARFSELSAGRIKPTINDLFPPSSVTLVYSIRKIFQKAGIKDSDIWPKIIEYLTSPSLKDVPFIRISSMLYAALARKAASGRKKPPNQGMANDIEVISLLLPYCDAMFMDNECRAYLTERPLSESVDCYHTEIFSQNTKEEFLQYLNTIESGATKEHLKKIREVYGESWSEPYITLYEQQHNKAS